PALRLATTADTLVLKETSVPWPFARNPHRVAAHERSPDLVADQPGPMVRHGRSSPHITDHLSGLVADDLGRRAGRSGPAGESVAHGLLAGTAAHRPRAARAGACGRVRMARVRAGRGPSLAPGQPGRAVVQDASRRALLGRTGGPRHECGAVP